MPFFLRRMLALLLCLWLPAQSWAAALPACCPGMAAESAESAAAVHGGTEPCEHGLHAAAPDRPAGEHDMPCHDSPGASGCECQQCAVHGMALVRMPACGRAALSAPAPVIRAVAAPRGFSPEPPYKPPRTAPI